MVGPSRFFLDIIRNIVSNYCLEGDGCLEDKIFDEMLDGNAYIIAGKTDHSRACGTGNARIPDNKTGCAATEADGQRVKLQSILPEQSGIDARDAWI